MDVCVKQWVRSWIMGTAAMGLLSSGTLTAQTAPHAPQPAGRAAAQPAPLPPSPQAIRLAANESNENSPQLAESEVEARLRELYERDGREMPNMALSPAPAASQQATAAPQAAPAARPRYSSAPAITPPPKQQNRVTGFFKKLVPGGNKKAPTQAAAQPPRQLQPAYPSPPVVSSLPPVAQPRNIPQPAPVVQPQVATQQPAESAPQPAVQHQQPAQVPSNAGQMTRTAAAPAQAPVQRAQARTPSTQAARPVAAARSSATPAARPVNAGLVQPSPALRVTPRSGETFQPARSPVQEASPQIGEPEILLDDEETEDSMELDDLDMDQAPPPATPSVAAPSSGFDEEFPDPFAGTAEGEPSSEAIENPYTGRTLEPLEGQPAALTPIIAPQARVDRTATDETTATKMRRIIQRTDIKGLKGFCPVTLRDQRELADSRPEHVATYRGQKFYCASKVAQAKFEADPARYAPAAYGADVVILTDDQDVAEGSLDYAAWYKGRLYLFSNQETHDTFVANPERYASPAGIE